MEHVVSTLFLLFRNIFGDTGLYNDVFINGIVIDYVLWGECDLNGGKDEMKKKL